MDRDTVAVYEERASDWSVKRPARFPERAEALAARLSDGAVRLDAGCGSGAHLPFLGRPVVALDAAHAMLRIARDRAPDAWCVQADLEALPIRRGAVRGTWARASYLHIERTRLPWALMQLHSAMVVGAPGALTFRAGDHEGALAGDDFPGRFFAEWQPQALRDVFVGAGFAVDGVDHDGGEWIHVRVTRARTLPDFVGPGLRLLICGLNPSEYSADAGVGFARPGNRFWPAALEAGIVVHARDPIDALVHHRIGMTDLCKRATPRADMLTTDEYADGLARVERLVRWLKPRAICFVGLAGWRAVVDRKAVAGEQAGGFAGSRAYVMPNTSGLNAHSTPAVLAAHLAAAARLADES